MNSFLHLFLIGFIIIHYVYSFRIIEKKHHRSRRCVCLQIKSLCQCNNGQKLESESPIHHQQQQFYREEPLLVASAIEKNSTKSQPSSSIVFPSPSSACIPNCLQGCMQNQYSNCQQSCKNTCKMEQSIPIINSPKVIPQQQNLRQMMPESRPMQYQTWESNIQKDNAASMLKINTQIPMAISNTSVLLAESNKSPFPLFSDSNVGQLNIPHGQVLNDNKNICTQACMPSCHSQCTQQSASVIISVSQHQLPLESIPQNQLLSDSAPHHQLLSESVPQHQLPLESIPQHQLLSDSVSHHQLPSKSVPQHQLPLESIPQHQLLSDSVSHHQLPLESNSLQHELATYNNNMPNLTQVPCASICMPSCPNQCIYQSTMLSGAFYPSLSPALTYPSPIIQLQPTASESKQQHSAKIGKISTNTQKTQHFSACLYICQDNCMQQCLQQNRSTDQCSISCSYACHDNCAKQRQQQQQQLTQSQELPQFIHHQSQQISRIQHSPSFIHIRQVQKIPNTKISQEQYYQSNG